MEDSTSLSRKPLSTIDSNTRNLGLSPTKPVSDRLSSSSSMLFESSVSSRIVENIGLRQVDKHSYMLQSNRTMALLLGRARHPFEDTSLTPSSSDSQVGSTRVCRVPLPSSAKHVSRDHAIVFHSPFGKTWAIKILGQNGLIVNGKRRKAGLVLRLVPFSTTLDFFGVHCLFTGDDRDRRVASRSSSASLEASQADELGLSPTKRHEMPLKRSTLGTALSSPTLSSIASPFYEKRRSPLKRKWVGNAEKRPMGAPPSPPTSSPMPFGHSSPIKSSREVAQHTVIPSSSPIHQLSNNIISSELDDASESSDDDYQDSTASPSLSRMSTKHDDSGVAIQDENDSDDEDEASQALKLASNDAHQERDTGVLGPEIDEDEVSPSPVPKSRKMPKKQVTFISQPTTLRSLDKGPELIKEVSPSLLSTDATPLQQLQNHLRSVVSQLVETYDIQGLLAEAIVFHRTATISATEAVRSVLTSNLGLLRGEIGPAGGSQKGQIVPGWTFEQMKQDGMIDGTDIDKEKLDVWQRKAWREKLEECLLEGDCFGIISRAGKDASGNPLECWYYYDKEHDADRDRAANLGALAKPMRAALKTHKPIFWKKSAYGHSSTADVSKGDVCMATESQWGSSGSTLDSLLFSKSSVSNAKDNLAASSQSVASSTWEETQYEEREKTWDRVGDDDFEMKAAKKLRRRR